MVKGVSVSISPQQTPLHNVTPTLRQRLMEPPRLSSPQHFPHSPGNTSTATPMRPSVTSSTAAITNQDQATPNNPNAIKKMQILLSSQPSNAKSTVTVTLQKSTPHLANMSNPSFTSTMGSVSNVSQNGIDSVNLLQSNTPTVKNLLAKKLNSGATSESHVMSAVPRPQSSSISKSNSVTTSKPASIPSSVSTVHIIKADTSLSSLTPASSSSIMPCPAVTSSQMNPGYRPVYQQGRSTVVTSESWSQQVVCPLSSHAASSSQTQLLPIPSQSITSQPHTHVNQLTAVQPSHLYHPTSTPSSSSDTSTHNNMVTLTSQSFAGIGKDESNRELTAAPMSNAQKQNQMVLPVSAPVQTPNLVGSNRSIDVHQQSNINAHVIQPSSSSMNPSSINSQQQQQKLQQQTVKVQVVQHGIQNATQIVSSTPNNSITQQGANVTFVQQHQTGPTIIPQQPSLQPHQINVQPQPVLSVQGSSLVVGARAVTNAGLVQQQQQQQSTITVPSSITLNHIIRAPSSVQIAGQQAQRVLGNATAVGVSSMSLTNPQQLNTVTVTQSISSPAVAALLTSNSHQQASPQMLISTPVQGTTSHTQVGGVGVGVPSTVVIQAQPRTIVVPSRQLVVQGNVQSQQNQSQPGSVSFVMQPNYRQATGPSSLIIQQQPGGGVNMIPSLTLQTQQQALTSNIATPQGAQLSGTLGPSRIVINQSSLPVGMQIASVTGNTSNICVNPQVQQQQQPGNLVIQSIQAVTQPNQSAMVPNQQLLQRPPVNCAASATVVQIPNANASASESQLSRSDAIPLAQQNNLLSSTVVIPQQQIQNSHLRVQVSQSQQQQPLQVPMTTPVQTQMAHCNGSLPEINGALGSPDSMSSDLPPSPMSSGGMLCDKDIPNGKLDSDEGLSIKASISNIMEKSAISKVNGFVHANDNGLHHDPSKLSSLSSTTSTTTTTPFNPAFSRIQSTVPVIANGPLIVKSKQPPTAVDGRTITVKNNGTVICPVSQNDKTLRNPLEIRAHSSSIVPRPMYQQRPSQLKGPQQYCMTAPNPSLPSSIRPQTQIRFSSVSSTTAPTNGPVIKVVRTPAPPISRSISEDSEVSNDSVGDLGDKTASSSKAKKKPPVKTKQPKKAIASQTSTASTLTARPQRNKKKAPPVEVVMSVAGTAKDGKATPIKIIMEYRCEWGPCRR